MRQGDTPYLISSNFGLLIDQDEKGSLSCPQPSKLPPVHHPFSVPQK